MLESSWINRYYDVDWMRSLLDLVGLGGYYDGNAPGHRKSEGIVDYLSQHQEIERYIVIDDDDYWNFGATYGMDYIRPHHLITEQDCQVANAALAGNYQIQNNSGNISIVESSSEMICELTANYEKVDTDKGNLLVVNSVNLNTSDDDRRIIMIRHLIAESHRLMAKCCCKWGVALIIPKILFKGVLVHHLYGIGKSKSVIEGAITTKNDECVVAMLRDYSGPDAVKRWEKAASNEIGGL